jgi:N-acyl-D-amino-acid deacylase
MTYSLLRQPGPAWERLRRLVRGLAMTVAAAVLAGSVAAQQPSRARYDIVLRGGTVVDGSGGPRYRADLAIQGDRIARVARDGLPAGSGRLELDATGLVVSPGFVDHHAHISTTIHERPLAENFLFQGITTIVASLHSGDVPWPLKAYMDSLRTAPNVGFFAGHSWARKEVMGLANRPPTPSELERMRALVEQAMRDGALGLSTGLLYVPANYATTEEVIELAKVAARFGGIYVTHMRDEARGLLESVREAIRIGTEARLPVQINHHKAAGAGQFGWSVTTLAMIDSARDRGLDVKHDLYPYAAGSTGSGVLFPQWALAGGPDSLRARVADPTVRARLEVEMLDRMRQDWAGEDLARIQFRELFSDRRYDGKTLADLARDRGLPVSAATGVQLAIELQLQGGFSAIYHMMDEGDVVRIMKHPYAMFETDGDPIGYGRGFPHPRSYGAFARVLARYVREQNVLTLEEAVRRMTSLSMEQLGQVDRGLIREGMLADIVVFDAERVMDLATYQDPHRFSVGMVHILVNGVPVLRDGSLTGAKPGRVLKRKDSRT